MSSKWNCHQKKVSERQAEFRHIFSRGAEGKRSLVYNLYHSAVLMFIPTHYMPHLSSHTPAIETFKLLLELSYGPSYTRRSWDEPTLPHQTLIQLILVADRLAFTRCIEACCEQLRTVLKADVALLVIDSLSHLDPAREPIQLLLGAAIESLGHIEDMWRQTPLQENSSFDIDNVSMDGIQVCSTQP